MPWKVNPVTIICQLDPAAAERQPCIFGVAHCQKGHPAESSQQVYCLLVYSQPTKLLYLAMGTCHACPTEKLHFERIWVAAHLLIDVDDGGVGLRILGKHAPAAHSLPQCNQHVRHGLDNLLRDDAYPSNNSTHNPVRCLYSREQGRHILHSAPCAPCCNNISAPPT